MIIDYRRLRHNDFETERSVITVRLSFGVVVLLLFVPGRCDLVRGSACLLGVSTDPVAAARHQLVFYRGYGHLAELLNSAYLESIEVLLWISQA